MLLRNIFFFLKRKKKVALLCVDSFSTEKRENLAAQFGLYKKTQHAMQQLLLPHRVIIKIGFPCIQISSLSRDTTKGEQINTFQPNPWVKLKFNFEIVYLSLLIWLLLRRLATQSGNESKFTHLFLCSVGCRM